ncbi:hypothetical protein AAMO2058_001293300 [Amorphochlora amoebiformis]
MLGDMESGLTSFRSPISRPRRRAWSIFALVLACLAVSIISLRITNFHFRGHSVAAAMALRRTGYIPSMALPRTTMTARKGKRVASGRRMRVEAGGVKFVNNPDDIVTEALDGLVAAHPFLTRLDGYPEIKVVLRADWEDPENENKVAVISGGGGGHEPAHAGYVGKGMLTAAVSGDVFASPSALAVLAAIRSVAYPGGDAQRAAKKSPGVLLIIKNYTGDRINFRIAAEQARIEGIPVEMVVVADDCALPSSKGVTGRRGIAGTALVHKIAGGAAEAGLPLGAVKEEAEATIDSLASLGVSSSVCHVPGRTEDETRIPGDQVEMGLGIHGEPGAAKIPLASADSLADNMIDIILDPSDGRNYMNLQSGDSVVLLVNNLGSATALEISIFTKSVLSKLDSMGVSVERIIAGPLVTSMDMAGISLSLIKLEDATRDTLLDRIDSDTNAPGWPRGGGPRPKDKKLIPVPFDRASNKAARFSRPKTLTPKGLMMDRVLMEVSKALEEGEESLTDWDNKVGDGDCGVTFKRGAIGIREDLSRYPVNSMADTLQALTETVARTMGGTSGALYRILLLSLSTSAREYEEKSMPMDTAGAAAALHRAVDAMSNSGGAIEGDRTMLDALYPAVHALRRAAEDGMELKDALQIAVEAAENGAESTKGMLARAGRSNYVPDDVLATTPDPGAKATAMWMRAALGAL